jgi:D-lactate dehydrogenase
MPRGGSVPGDGEINPESARKVVYFPSCIARTMGPAKDDPSDDSIMDVTVRVLARAGYSIIFPQDMGNLCCGTPWESKGLADIADQKATELEKALLTASNNGRYPVLCDTSPCLYRMRKVMADPLHLYEPVEFIHAFLRKRLEFKPKKETIAVHATCSTTKLGLSGMLEQVAGLCAARVIMPPDVNCCGFAGDKGFNLPELNEHGLRKAVPVVQQEGAVAGYSNSRTCEIGCATYTGIPYMSIMYLVDETSKPRSG